MTRGNDPVRASESLVGALRCAWQGIRSTFATERNFRIQSGVALAAIVAAGALRVPFEHALVVLVLIAAVFSAELANTAVERAVDLVSPDRHPLAGAAKDAAAGAVLVLSLASVLIGGAIFVRAALVRFGVW